MNLPILQYKHHGSDRNALARRQITRQMPPGSSIHETSDFYRGPDVCSVPIAAPDAAFAWPAIIKKLDFPSGAAFASTFVSSPRFVTNNEDADK